MVSRHCGRAIIIRRHRRDELQLIYNDVVYYQDLPTQITLQTYFLFARMTYVSCVYIKSHEQEVIKVVMLFSSGLSVFLWLAAIMLQACKCDTGTCSEYEAHSPNISKWCISVLCVLH